MVIVQSIEAIEDTLRIATSEDEFTGQINWRGIYANDVPQLIARAAQLAADVQRLFDAACAVRDAWQWGVSSSDEQAKLHDAIEAYCAATDQPDAASGGDGQ